MGTETAIQWTDSTFNPWEGCTKVGPGCDHCYAEEQRDKWLKRVEWGAGKPRRRTSTTNWKHPLRWDHQRFMQCGECAWRGECDAELIGCGACGSISQMNDARRRVFCASLADWLDNEVPIEWLVDLLDLIRRTPNLDWLLLSKRIGNWRKRILAAISQKEGISQELAAWLGDWLHDKPPQNVWIGATVVNQAEADRDLLWLMDVAAVVRFVSIEPMLGPIDLTRVVYPKFRQKHENDPYIAYDMLRGHMIGPDDVGLAKIDWVICGGESGSKARPMHPDWARSLRDQCAAAGVAFHFKQWGEYWPFANEDHYTHGGAEKHAHAWVDRDTADHGLCWIIDDDGTWSNWTGSPRTIDGNDAWEVHPAVKVMGCVGKKAAGRKLDGIEHNAFPVPR